MEQTYTSLALRVHDLGNEVLEMRGELCDIKKIMSRIYLLGWSCFLALLGILGEIVIR